MLRDRAADHVLDRRDQLGDHGACHGLGQRSLVGDPPLEVTRGRVLQHQVDVVRRLHHLVQPAAVNATGGVGWHNTCENYEDTHTLPIFRNKKLLLSADYRKCIFSMERKWSTGGKICSM